jgi:hypothetical protein
MRASVLFTATSLTPGLVTVNAALDPDTHPPLSFPWCNVVSLPTARPREILGASRARLLPPPPSLYPVEPGLTVPGLRHGHLERMRGPQDKHLFLLHLPLPGPEEGSSFQKEALWLWHQQPTTSRYPLFTSSTRGKPSVLSEMRGDPEHTSQLYLHATFIYLCHIFITT